MSNPNPNPTIAQLQAAIAQLSALVQAAVAQIPQTTVTVIDNVDQAVLAGILSQVAEDTTALSAALPATTEPGS
jgi:hypothetical protein